ncbi:MAG: formate hydrogenlyase transcriptional activator [Desulforhopalus sp.]|jgi:formate hydrogenlyase transcriptional activator
MAPLDIKMCERRDNLQFESLLVEISTLFINLAVDQINSKIEHAQRLICEYLDLDRSTLWQFREQEPEILLLTHIYQSTNGELPVDKMNGKDFFPWIVQKMISGETVTISKMDDLPKEAVRDRESFELYGAKSGVYVPLSIGQGPVFGVLTFATMKKERDWPFAERLQLVAQVFAHALERKRVDCLLQGNINEIEKLKDRLEQENTYLQGEVKLLTEHSEILGQSTIIKNILTQAEQVAETDSTVILLGETGTGKELLARAIHNMSLRKDRPLITINCAALPASLIENELFGREKGAYTGAMTKMIGRFELADESTLFLDEIGELSLDLQSKLLRVLEEGKFERLGSTKSVQINVRIIAATNRDLEQEVSDGNFRQDLFYRINVFPILIPPLRDRSEDIPILVRSFVRKFQKRMGKQIERIPHKVIQALKSYSWPGNVRELRNMIERGMILSNDKTLLVQLPKKLTSKTEATDSLDDIMRREILVTLKKTHWRIGGRDGTAEILGLKRSTLYSKMKKLGIHRTSS